MRRLRRRTGLGKAVLLSFGIFLGSILVGLIVGVWTTSPLVTLIIIIIGTIAGNVIFWKRLGGELKNDK